jgi:hypothetical protein
VGIIKLLKEKFLKNKYCVKSKSHKNVCIPEKFAICGKER